MKLFMPVCGERRNHEAAHQYCCKDLCHEPEVEPKRYYISCFECRHYYRTRWHLSAAYLGRVVEMREWALLNWHTLRRVLRPKLIFFCQCCVHDF